MNIKVSKLHKIIGIFLTLPLLGWILTGAIFIIQPGYQGAYHQIKIKTYPLSSSFIITPQEQWLEIKLVRSILGEHLLVLDNSQWSNLDPLTLKPAAKLNKEQTSLLINDALSVDVMRYGEIVEIIDQRAVTSTDVEINLNWDSLTLRQSGSDTKFINWLYKVHYLQWFGIKTVNQYFAVFSLALLLLLASCGVYLTFRKR